MPLISKFFGYNEFACHTGEPYPPEWIDERLQPLCAVLDAIRERWGAQLVVISGYRTPAYNAQLRAQSSGVAENSQHPQGRAADIAPMPRTREACKRLAAVVDAMVTAGELPGLGGRGRYPGWVHVDVRPVPEDGHIARWDGAGFGSEPVA